MFLRDIGGALIIGLVPFALWTISSQFGSIPPIAAAYATHIGFATILWLLVIWFALVVIWTNYYLDLWIVTDRHIFHIEQIGLFNRRVAVWNMDRVQAVGISTTNALQTLFGYGTIKVQTGGPTDEYAMMEGVPQPDHVRSVILGQIEHFSQLAEANQKQEDLLHFVSHEVKGHLAKNKAAFASIIEGDYGNVPQTLTGMAGAALADTQKGVETVMDILDTSDLKSGAMRFEMQPFDLKDSVQKVVDDFLPAAREKGLALEYAPSAEVFRLNGDEPKIRRHVIRNLIDNAIRYTPMGSIRVELSCESDFARLSVRDSGIGIAAEDRRQLFTAGGKGAESSSINTESTGYGLFVAKKVVEAHGGTIQAFSDGRGLGTEFVVKFPLA